MNSAGTRNEMKGRFKGGSGLCRHRRCRDPSLRSDPVSWTQNRCPQGATKHPQKPWGGRSESRTLESRHVDVKHALGPANARVEAARA